MEPCCFKKASSAESVLAFLSNSDDDYRPKWGKSQVSIARSCVIVGTTNEERFLRGRFNRRFWIVNAVDAADRGHHIGTLRD